MRYRSYKDGAPTELGSVRGSNRFSRQGEPPERWTLMFFGEKLNLLAQFPEAQDIFIEGQTGG
jgi:hypothetical protein